MAGAEQWGNQLNTKQLWGKHRKPRLEMSEDKIEFRIRQEVKKKLTEMRESLFRKYLSGSFKRC